MALIEINDPLRMLSGAKALLSGTGLANVSSLPEIASANCMPILRYIFPATKSGILSSFYEVRWKLLTRDGFLAYSTATYNSGIWFAFSSMRTVILGVSAALTLAFAWYALETGFIIGLVLAGGFVAVLGLALWLIWRPERVVNQTAQQSLESLQRQAKANNLKQLWSGIGAVFGALLILLIGFLVFFNGSTLAGLLFFCSGAMAMRAAWTLLWVQRGARGKER